MPVISLPAIEGYEVLELVGRGGMGKVYRARQLDLGRVVALKVLAQEPDERLLARFREETRAIAHLQHPNIAQLFESGVAGGQPFYTQEFLEGGTLAQLLDGRPLEPQKAAAILELISRAIQHSHENGILHRDLKPSNILLAADGTPKLTDFGLAKQFRETRAGETPVESGGGLTRTGDILGTPAYMPPEQATGVVSSIGPAADVYGLGAILYEMLTGRPPFQAPDSLQTLFLVLTMDPVAPRSLQPKVPRDLETICLKCLEKNPGKRYLTAKELGDDLRRFLNGEPIVARPVGPFVRMVKWARRRKALAALLAVSVVAAILLAAAGIALVLGYFKLQSSLEETRTANQKLEEANQETKTTLDLTLASIDRYFFEYSDLLRTVPNGEVLRRIITDEARKLLDELGRLRPNDAKIRLYRAAGYIKLGGAEDALGRHRQAAEAFVTARELLAALAAEFPDEWQYQQQYARATLTLANKFLQLGDKAGARQYFAEAYQRSDELLAAHPKDRDVLVLADEVQFNRYRDAFDEGSREKAGSEAQKAKDRQAIAELRKSIDICRALAAAEPADKDLAWHLIDRELSLAAILMASGQSAEAETLINQAREIVIDRMPASPPPRLRLLAASIWSHLAQLHNDQKKFIHAETEYRTAAALYEALAQDFPNNPQYRYQAANTWFYAGDVARLAGRLEDAGSNYKKSLGFLTRLIEEDRSNRQYQTALKFVLEAMKALPQPGKKP